MKDIFSSLLVFAFTIILGDYSYAQQGEDYFIAHNLGLDYSFPDVYPFIGLGEDVEIVMYYGLTRGIFGYLDSMGNLAVKYDTSEYFRTDTFQLLFDQNKRLTSIQSRVQDVAISYSQDSIIYQFNRTEPLVFWNIALSRRLVLTVDSSFLPQNLYFWEGPENKWRNIRTYTSQIRDAGMLEVKELMDQDLFNIHFFSSKRGEGWFWSVYDPSQNRLYQKLRIDKLNNVYSIYPNDNSNKRYAERGYKRVPTSKSAADFREFMIMDNNFAENIGIIRIFRLNN